MSEDKRTRFTFRIPRNLMVKLDYIAKFDGRSKNEEIEQMMCEWIRAFEDVEGEILLENKKRPTAAAAGLQSSHASHSG